MEVRIKMRLWTLIFLVLFRKVSWTHKGSYCIAFVSLCIMLLELILGI